MLDQLFTKFKVKNLEFPNRIVMAPMTRRQSPNSIPTDTVAEYYWRRASGGLGMIITEGTLVDHPLAAPVPDIPRIHGASLDGWRKVLDRCRPTGVPFFVQLWHQGPKARPGIGAVPVVEEGEEVVQEAKEKDCQDIFEAFTKAARLAKEVGFDGIEFHGAHGYLLDSFIRAGNVSFVCDIVRESRKLVGPDYPLCIRFSQWGVGDFEARQFATPGELENVLLPLKDAGIDIFHASTRRFWIPEFEGSDLNLAGWTKKITSSPTITVGNIGLVTSEFTGEGPESSKSLMERFENGEFDLVSVGRALLNEPEWCNKVRDDRTDEILEWTQEANKVFP